MSGPPPQLARACLRVDTSSDDDDFSTSDSVGSLEILAPKGSAPASKTSMLSKKDLMSTKKADASSLTSFEVPCRLSDSDSDDQLLTAKIGLSTNPTSSSSATSASRNKKQRPLVPPVGSSSIGDGLAMEAVPTPVSELTRQQIRDREKRARAEQREQNKRAREQQKHAEKQAKKRALDIHQQSIGKFSHEEIVVLVDPSLYHHSQYDLLRILQEDFLVHCYPSRLLTTRTTTKAIQWIRKDFLQGGAHDALERLMSDEADGRQPGASSGADNMAYHHLQHTVMIMEADDFISLVQSHQSKSPTSSSSDLLLDKDYPALKAWLDELVESWQQAWNTDTKPRLLLLLDNVMQQLDKTWVEHRRKCQGRSGVRSPSSSPPTEWDVRDAIQWLLIQHQVECVMCDSAESVQLHVHRYTRGLAESPYYSDITELECIRKLKSGVDENSATDLEKASDTWMRQLQQVPRISEPMARNLVQHYPTLRSLWEAYSKNGLDNASANQKLVADLLRENRSERKVSESLYRVVTSNIPSDMV